MTGLSRWLTVAGVALAMCASPSTAQDDLLAPLVPKAKVKSKSKPKAKTWRKKPKAAKRPSKTGPDKRLEEDLIAPLVSDAQGQLVVRVPNGYGAAVLVDGREVGRLPMAPIELPAGEHQLVVRRPGYADFQQTVLLAAGKTVELVGHLEAVAGILTVTVNQPGAEVLINGSPVGEAPVTELVLPPGAYQVLTRKPGFTEVQQTVLIRAGSQYRLALELAGPAVDRPERASLLPAADPSDPVTIDFRPESEPPLYARWYVWAGAAAVVTAATVGIVVATQNTAEPQFDPNREVCRTQNCTACIPASRCAAP